MHTCAVSFTKTKQPPNPSNGKATWTSSESDETKQRFPEGLKGCRDRVLKAPPFPTQQEVRDQQARAQAHGQNPRPGETSMWPTAPTSEEPQYPGRAPRLQASGVGIHLASLHGASVPLDPKPGQPLAPHLPLL